MRQKLIAPSAVLVLVIIGLWGQYVLAPERLSDQFSTSLYQIVMLFFFSGEWTVEIDSLPIQIELVRFFAPFATVTSIILVFAENSRITWSNYFARFSHGHTIVVGLGDKSTQFLRTSDHKSTFVVVERDPENLAINAARSSGITVIIGDIFDPGMFTRIALRQASTLLAFTGNDGTNVELAIKSRYFVQQTNDRTRHLKVQIHLNEINLAHQLESYPKFFDDYSTTEVSFFSVFDLSARLMLRDYPPEIFADVANQAQVHFMIYGFDRLAETLVIEAALLCHYANNQKTRFTIIDESANSKSLAFVAENPNLDRICDYTFISHATLGSHTFSGDLKNQLPTVTQHIVCRDTDEENLKIALMLRTTLLEIKASNAPILVRMQQSSGLAQLLESNTGAAEVPDGLFPFGMLDHVLHVDNVLTNRLDGLAQSIHQNYLASQSDLNSRAHVALKSWNDLPQLERKQNLLKADHWSILLRAVGYRASVHRQRPPVFSEERAERMARTDHNRYVANKLYDGWVYGESRIEEAKVNPHLVEWEKLPKEQRQREILEARQEPQQFAKTSDFFVTKNHIIGVTGHRLNKLDLNDQQLRQRIATALGDLKKQHPDVHFIIMSPLAEGADRLVVELAMNILHATLHVPLPLPYELYVSDFSDKESVEEFKRLVGLAESYYELPMRFGNIRDLALAENETNNEARNQQYALAGAYIIQRCDSLIAVYDGRPEAGTGGTGQIVRWFNEASVDSDYRYQDHYFQKPQKQHLITVAPSSD